MSGWNHSNLYDFKNPSRSNGSHQRSSSVVGYSDYNVSDAYHSMEESNLPKQPINNYCSSYVDISNAGKDMRKFSWHSPSSNVAENSKSKRFSVQQRPFESSFKTAINKMKEASLSRLGNVQHSKTKSINTDNFYFDRDDNAASATSAISRGADSISHSIPRRQDENSGHNNTGLTSTAASKVFRYNSTSSASVGLPSVSDNVAASVTHRFPVGSTSSTLSRTEQVTSYTPRRSPIHSVGREEEVCHRKLIGQTQSLDRKSHVTPKSEVRIVIPVKSSAKSNATTQAIPCQVEEPMILATESQRVKAAAPKTIIKYGSATDITVDDEDPNTEPLPSVQEIIAKVEALNQESSPKSNSVHHKVGNKAVTATTRAPASFYDSSGTTYNIATGGNIKSVINTHKRASSFNKPDGIVETQFVRPVKMSGLYRKAPVNPTKTKTVSKMPEDFQKLHSAFLDQLKEIVRLKKELEEKKQIITQLELQLKSYEPWR